MKTNIKLPLTITEKESLKKNKVRLSEIPNYAADELEVLLNVSANRARTIT